MVKAGQKLKNFRIKNKFTLEDVSKATKINSRFLFAIENSEYGKIPSATYALGFVRNYAKFLGLPEEEILALFRREYDEKRMVRVLPAGLTKQEDFPLKRIRLSQTIKIAGIIFALLIFYIIFQYRYAFLDPPLKILVPKDGQIFSSQSIEVMGKTDSNASVFINGDPVSLDESGNFNKNLKLFVGKTNIEIKVINYFGKEVVVNRQVEVKER